MGPLVAIPLFVVWFRFRLLRRYLALWTAEVGRVYRLLELVGDGCPGHGPINLLSSSAAEIGFQWDPHALAWVRPGLPLLSNLAGPIQHFQAAILDALRKKVATDLCKRKGFRGGHLLDVHGSLQLLIFFSCSGERQGIASCHYGWWCLEWLPAWSCSWSACSMSVLWGT